MKVIVFGAGGYLGIPLCEELYRLGHDVYAHDRFYFGKEPKLNYNVARADIRTIAGWTSGVDAVIDLAGLSNDASAEIDPQLTTDINERGGLNLIRRAQECGVRRYIYSSSCSVYGHASKLGVTEEDFPNTLTAYAKSKVIVEQHALVRKSKTFEPVILRNATAFGVAPRMRFDLAVNIMTLRAWRDGIIYVMMGGKQWRPFLSVQDIVRAFVMALEAPAEKVSGQIFNVGDDSLNMTIEQVANIVHEEFPFAKVHHIPDNPDERSYNVSFKKIESVLGFKATQNVLDGVREIKSALINRTIDPDDPTCITLDWYKSLLSWDKRITDLKIDGKLL